MCVLEKYIYVYAYTYEYAMYMYTCMHVCDIPAGYTGDVSGDIHMYIHILYNGRGGVGGVIVTAEREQVTCRASVRTPSPHWFQAVILMV